jgi:hypothetical protein
LSQLASTRKPCDHACFPKASGVYGWFVKKNSALTDLKVGDDGLIYIGMAVDLTRRELMQHLRSNGTGGSSLRRSLGAILKKELELRAIPRSESKTDSKRFSHFRFTAEGEAKVTKWMHQNLEIGFFECLDYKVVESALIRDRKPLLCLTGWNNPDRAEIRRLRKQCALEARGTA